MQLITRKAPGALTPPFSLPLGSKIYLMGPRKIQAQVVIYRMSYVFAVDNVYQGMNCPIFSVLACVTKTVMNCFDHSVTQSDPNSYCTIKMGMNASSICCLSKLTSTFVLALIEWKLTRLNSLYFSTLVSRFWLAE